MFNNLADEFNAIANNARSKITSDYAVMLEDEMTRALQHAQETSQALIAKRELIQNILRADYGVMHELDTYIDLRIAQRLSDDALVRLQAMSEGYKQRIGGE